MMQKQMDMIIMAQQGSEARSNAITEAAARTSQAASAEADLAASVAKHFVSIAPAAPAAPEVIPPTRSAPPASGKKGKDKKLAPPNTIPPAL